MRPLSIALLGLCGLLAACGHNKEQKSASGAGGGIIAGALIAGPVGAVVGAAAGGAGGNAVGEAEKSENNGRKSSGGSSR